MKSFLQFINESIPVGEYDNDEKENVGHFVHAIEKAKKHDIVTKTINPSEMIKNGTLKATQHHIGKGPTADEGSEPVFPKLRKPVLVHKDGVHHIIDGHHRISWAHKHGKTIDVHVHNYKSK